MAKRGGPKSPWGREKSSRNSTTHGLRATRVLILAGESQDDYDDTREGWLATYEPENFHERSLVEQLILNHWMMQRANRRLLEAEADLVGSEETRYADGWTPAQEHTLDLVQRYKTTHERAFYRSLNAVESLRKDILRNELLKNKLIETKDKRIKDLEADLAKRPPAPEAMPEAKEKAVALPLTRAQQVFGGQKSKKKQKKIVILDQWVEIEVLPNGKTFTALSPSNEILIQDGQKKWPPPEMVYRRMHFVNGVPPEYYWTTSNESIRATGGMGIQRMTTDTWLELIEKEKELGAGHLLPCGNLPRPEERGGCDCPTCSNNRAILEARAA